MLSFCWKMQAQERFKFSEVEFLIGTNGSGFVAEVRHIALRSQLPVSEQDFIIQMGKCVKGTERETVPRKQELAEGTIARHPGNAKRIWRGKVQRALHRDTDGTTRSENGGDVPPLRFRKERR